MLEQRPTVKLRKINFESPLKIKMSDEELWDWAALEPKPGKSYQSNYRQLCDYRDKEGSMAMNLHKLLHLNNKGIKSVNQVGDIYLFEHYLYLKKFNPETPMMVKIDDDEVSNWASNEEMRPLVGRTYRENCDEIRLHLDAKGYLETDLKELFYLINKGIKQVDRVGDLYFKENNLQEVEYGR